MTFFTVAIGDNYVKEALRLKQSVPNLHIFTVDHALYEKLGENQLADGLYHKSNFANYIPNDAIGPIFFMDADLYSDITNPMETFEIEDDIDFAFVPYQGKWYFPDEERKHAESVLNCKLNSGFMYFKNINVAKEMCDKWLTIMKRRLPLNIHEFDEYSLMIVIANGSWKWKYLEPKWNDWGENIQGEPIYKDAIFKQKHIQ